MSSIDSILGLPEKALAVHDRRNTLLAKNIANADTPGFKARDIDFGAQLKAAGNALTATSAKMNATREGHVTRALSNVFPTPVTGDLLYRVPMQNSLDGNTVKADTEQAAFAENSVRYQAAVRFLDGRAKGLLSAIRGQ